MNQNGRQLGYFGSMFGMLLSVACIWLCCTACNNDESEGLVIGEIVGTADNLVGYVDFDKETEHWCITSDPAELDEHPDSIYYDGKIIPRSSLVIIDYSSVKFYPVSLDQDYQIQNLRVVFSGSYSNYPTDNSVVVPRYVIKLTDIRRSKYSVTTDAQSK